MEETNNGSGTPLIRSPMGQKNLVVLTGVFFLRENVWRFLLGGQKNGRNNEATVLPRSRPGRWKAEDLTGPDHHINNFQSP